MTDDDRTFIQEVKMKMASEIRDLADWETDLGIGIEVDEWKKGLYLCQSHSINK